MIVLSSSGKKNIRDVAEDQCLGINVKARWRMVIGVTRGCQRTSVENIPAGFSRSARRVCLRELEGSASGRMSLVFGWGGTFASAGVDSCVEGGFPEVGHRAPSELWRRIKRFRQRVCAQISIPFFRHFFFFAQYASFNCAILLLLFFSFSSSRAF